MKPESWCTCKKVDNTVSKGLHLRECIERADSPSLSQILDSRQEDYGDAKDNFTEIGKRWGVSAFDVAMMMIDLKLVRIRVNPNKEDSWLDLLGYIHHAQNLIPDEDGE